MKTSVIIPCYNCSKHICLVIDHLLNQSLPFDEIIVVDDFSIDNSRSILTSLPVQVLLHDHNQGPAAARNTGAKKAKGDILIFIDSDAYAFPDLNEKILEIYSKNFADKHFGGLGGQGIEREINNIYDEWRKIHSAQNFGTATKLDVPYLFGLCCSYPRDVFTKVGGFDPYFRINAGEDLDLGIRIRKLGYRLDYDPSLRVQHFHKDTKESLLKVQYNWSFWSYISKLRTNSSTFKFVLGPYWRLFRYSVEDIVKGRMHLLNLNYEVFRAKTKAIQDVHKKIKK